jgi:hypothetical protein
MPGFKSATKQCTRRSTTLAVPLSLASSRVDLERVKDITDGLKGQASYNDELCSTKPLKVVYAVQLADKSLLDETAKLIIIFAESHTQSRIIQLNFLFRRFSDFGKSKIQVSGGKPLMDNSK